MRGFWCSSPVSYTHLASVSFSNVLKKFTVTMEKVDSVTGEAQGDASLDGAVYGMFKGETLLDTYTRCV